MGRGIFGLAKMGRGKQKQKQKNPKQIICLTSQVRCADMPAARQQIHFFTFLEQTRKIGKHLPKQKKVRNLKSRFTKRCFGKTPDGKRLADRYLCH